MTDLFSRNLIRWDPSQRINGIRYGRDIARWPDEDLAAIGLYRAKPPDVIPEGMQPGAGVEWDGSSVRYVLEEIPPAPRRRVEKWLIIERVNAAGKAAAADALLNLPGNEFAKFRWLAPVESVFFDDPDTVAMVEALELDPDVIMAVG
ncbi:hypothetical protein [Kaistia adipata]|uniref:hypothetical protein n=1 Tax=Kaistia adipata TaxID=166954 RepID=UPI0012EBB4DE|nr:hypothetical protein [Kaistia adipata]